MKECLDSDVLLMPEEDLRKPNMRENALRPSAIGKKNWLFIGHPRAGERSAIIYSILISCQRHKVDINEYLNDVLTQTPYLINRDQSHLTPKNWKQ